MAKRYSDYYFTPSRPKEAKGGIKAKSTRGSFGESWWAKRWIAVLESFEMGGRLGRGRNYARKGQVLNITIEKGTVKADVQGSRAEPYQVMIMVRPLGLDDWAKLASVMSHEAFFAAKLMAGEMPKDIERVFQDAGLSLFPTTEKDIQTDCSCPDWSKPCKHVAAVYYLLGEEFDRDPFLVFKIRGMSREEFVALLGVNEDGCAVEVVGAIGVAKGVTTVEDEVPRAKRVKKPALQPLSASANAFWNMGNLPEDLFGEIRESVDSAALVKRLGSFPFWRGALPLVEAVEPIYERAARVGVDAFLGEIGKSSGAGPQGKNKTKE